MKLKLIATSLFVCISFLFMSPTVSATTLAIHANGNVKNTDYLCIAGSGCFNIKQASNGKTFNLSQVNFTKLNRVALLNTATSTISSTPVNASCSNINDVAGNRTVTVNVKIGNYPGTQSSVVNSVSCSVH